MIISIETRFGITKIQLLENQFITEWIDLFIENLKHNAYSSQYGSFPYCPNSKKITKGNAGWSYYGSLLSYIIRERSKPLQNVIEELNAIGVTFPISVDHLKNEINNIDFNELDFIQLLNKVHRYCTVPVRTLRGDTVEQVAAVYNETQNNVEVYWSDEDPVNTTFSIAKPDIETFLLLMEKGNLGVHNIDCFVPTPRKLEYGAPKLRPHTFDYFTRPPVGIEPEFTILDKPDWQYASDSDEYDVWIAKDILGKNYQEAYFDHDDPTQWDVTQPLGHTGGFSITLTDSSSQSIIKSNNMQQWFKDYNIEYKPHMNNYPLGKVIEGKECLWPGRVHAIQKDACTVTYE